MGKLKTAVMEKMDRDEYLPKIRHTAEKDVVLTAYEEYRKTKVLKARKPSSLSWLI